MQYIKHPLIKENSIESREYQETLTAKIVQKGNTLVVAPTAIGKTIIAVLLTAHKLQENNNSKILFLAPTKPLVLQHEKSFKKFLNINEEDIVAITGTTKPLQRKEYYFTKKVITATPQTIENDILNGLITFKDFNLIIFDEAHRAIGDYAYVFINLQIQKQNQNALIVALTASPGNQEEKIQDVCRNLSITNIEIKNSEDKDVKQYVNEITVDWVKVDLPEKFLEIKNYLEKFSKEQLIFLKEINVAITFNKKYYNRTRILEMQRKIIAMIKDNQNPIMYTAMSRCAALLKISHAEELIETQGITALKKYFEKLEEESEKGKSKAAKQIMSHESIKKAINLTKELFENKIQHPKYKELKKIVLEQLIQNPQSKIIVFNQYRDSITSIVSFLEEEKEINVSKFIGQATKRNEKGMSQKIQQQVLTDLKEGKFNVLVTTSVAEEGLDIPAVEMVIFFEPVPSEIRTIQRRGRTGRFGKGKNIILMTKNTRDEAYYWASKAKEKNMKTVLTKMKNNNILPEQSTLANFSQKSEEIIIFVDSREQASSVAKELFEKKCKIIMKPLNIGDYVLSQDVCVERKTVEDFLNSMIDGRLFNQLIDLRENYPKPLVIIEGNMNDLYKIRNMHRNAIIGAITSIALDYNVPILNTKDSSETAEYLYVIAKREQIAKEKDIRIRMGRKGLTTHEQQQYIVEGFPLVGPLMAKKLLEKFENIKGIINASEKELIEIENMGLKKAKKIKKILEEKYEPNK
ncbi:MAG: DEAD/DEAH box helicase [Candidatus ainarchaeum sp.]|nr:DEAD/DEAH box helicase [Candidatus ainarchaeum sp.]